MRLEPDLQDVAVRDDVVLALQPLPARGLDRLHVAMVDEIVVRRGLGGFTR